MERVGGATQNTSGSGIARVDGNRSQVAGTSTGQCE
jgi:hypothetical protein